MANGPNDPTTDERDPYADEITESNARSDAYWRRVGGHPAPGVEDGDCEDEAGDDADECED